MTQNLRILFAEDVAMDYHLALEIIKKEIDISDSLLVDNADDFAKALEEFKPDVVISDYWMPQFDGLQALEITRNFDAHMPFIIITGSQNEEVAVNCMRQGADDYVIKENMKRLPFAVIEAYRRRKLLRENDAYLNQLEAKEKLFQMITENSSDILFILDMDLNYVFISPAVEKMNGYTVEETLKQHLNDVLTPESRQLVKEVFEEEYSKELRGENPPDYTRTIVINEIHASGKKIWVEAALKFVHDKDGKPVGVMGVSRDITTKKQAELKLIESETLLNFSQQFALMGSWEMDMKTKKIKWSENNFRLMGLEPFSLEPDWDYFAGCVHPDDRAWVKNTLDKLTAERKPISYNFRIIWPNGQVRWLQNEVVPVFEKDTLTHLKGVNLDITYRKQADKLLFDAGERLGLVLEASNQGLYDHFLQTDEIVVTDQYARLIGYDPNEFKETTEFWISRMHPDDREKVLKKYNDYIDGKVSEYRAEFRQKTKSGEWRWTLSIGKIVERDDKGKAVRMLGTHIDIDQSKRNELQVEEDNKYLKNLINSVQAPIVEWNENLTVTRFNKAAEILTGYKESEVLGQPIQGFFKIAVAPNLDEMIEGVLDKGMSLVDEEVAISRKDGTIRKVIWSTTNLFNNHATRHKTTIAIGCDITELIEAKENLRQSEERFRQIFENAPIGMISFDQQLILTSCNPSFSEIIGTPIEGLIGLDMNKLPDPNFKKALVRVSEGELSGFTGPYVSYTSGRKIEIKSLFTPFFDANDNFSGGVGIFEDISEQMAANRSLKESEERFSKMFYSSPVAKMLVALDDYKIIDANDSWCRFTGFTHEMALGKKINELKFINQSVFKEIIAEQAKLGINYQSELNFIDRTGNEKTGLLSAEKYNMAGKDFLVVVILDITERKLAELELTKLTRAVEQSPVSIVITDLEGTVEYINPRVTEITGYLPHELIGQNPRVFSSGEKPKEEYLEMYQTLQKGEVWTGEFHNKKKDGTLFWEKATIAPVINDEGLMTHYLAVKEDITMVKQLAQNLVESEKRYRDMFFNSPLPMWIYDVNTLRFEEVNQVAISRYGYTEKEFKSMTIEAVRPEEDLDLLYENIKNVTNEFQDKQVWRHKTKDGVLMDVEIVSHAIPSPPGKKLRLVLVNDVTEKIKAANTLRDAKALAEASDRLKTNFLNNISHEVRTPLNGILGAANLMSDPEISQAEINELLEIIQESSDRLIQTITDYMDISLLTSQNMEKYGKQVKLHEVFKSSAAKFERKFASKGINFRTEINCANSDVSLQTDEELLSKALHHLLSNALKFTRQGEVILGCTPVGDELEIFVSDTGIGIGKEYQTKIFEYFWQKDQSSARRFEGSGLGLSIVNGIARVLGAKVELVSEKGKGSRFSLIFPLNETNMGNKAETTELLASSPVVLIAEDEDSNYFVLELLMKQMVVAEVLRAVDGKEAVALAQKRDDIGLILMDIKMPEMDGLEATKLIKAKRPDLPIVAITAFAMSGDEHRIVEAGCDDYMAKPISMKLLIEKLKKFGLKLKG
ncbi:MAG: PAS domain S-box protein [Bacteroidales bacterium]|nr:PAS domain S-box protein [Bacteroidales bacterium]